MRRSPHGPPPAPAPCPRSPARPRRRRRADPGHLRAPGQPSTAAVCFWARRDPAFAAALTAAKAAGREVRLQPSLAFHEPTARTLIARLAAGETIVSIYRDPTMPNRRTYAHWRATQAWFAEEVGRLNAVKEAEKTHRCRRRLLAFDQARADAILLSVLAGNRLIDMAERPGLSVLARWRREEPTFDAELKACIVMSRRRRFAGAAVPPDLLEEIWRRVLDGDTLATIGLQPDMPCRATLYAWMKRDPAFHAEVAHALHFRRDMLADEVMEAGMDRGARLPGAKLHWENLCGKVDRIDARLTRWGYYEED